MFGLFRRKAAQRTLTAAFEACGYNSFMTIACHRPPSGAGDSVVRRRDARRELGIHPSGSGRDLDRSWTHLAPMRRDYGGEQYFNRENLSVC